ncbi:hypothetical protein CHGG_03899 [Chaetomium globosum CBS 148.51]|uniref:Major facilitator superfamily (MFS) profile domain-containing protein n=1 Tax=Chaetomium globosum (strain ATCC 6205 / CBS 148.51 / DSM 1962 / NBRC 6347 / NRRL 1970) TaxID=306901 RepID=Q2H2U7_CHAGB|nr:uncharacterized protein CHGG_03899 [Chaetomium globosum CBS 148.51]EAQ87280.1 hypothetical protein CHGG_03899 [Chaetomium globosum CBS 148.51]
MVGVVIYPSLTGTADLSRVEAPVTFKAYLLCAFAAYGGICEPSLLTLWLTSGSYCANNLADRRQPDRVRPAVVDQVVLFVMGRLVSGLGVGFISATILLYMAEVAPKRFRAESPRFHVMKGKINAAARDLSLVRGQPLDSDYIKDELAEIVANHEYEMQVIPQTSYIGSWMACFPGGPCPKATATSGGTIWGPASQMMQQLTGTWGGGRSSTGARWA